MQNSKTEKMPAPNERFAKIAALSRRKGSGILNSPTPLEVNRLPQLRQAATTLGASGRQRGGQGCGNRDFCGEHLTQHYKF